MVDGTIVVFFLYEGRFGSCTNKNDVTELNDALRDHANFAGIAIEGP